MESETPEFAYIVRGYESEEDFKANKFIFFRIFDIWQVKEAFAYAMERETDYLIWIGLEMHHEIHAFYYTGIGK